MKKGDIYFAKKDEQGVWQRPEPVEGELNSDLDEGIVSFTPDGPRGPRYHMSKGPIHLASMHQVPIVPVTVNASRYWECKSWDRFQIPKPFSTLTVVLGEPISIPADLDAEGLEKYRKIVEDTLNKVSGVRVEDIPTAEEIAEMQRKKAAKKAAKAAQKQK